MSGAMTKIILRGSLIMGVISIVMFAAYASSLEPQITYGTFSTGGIDLKIDSKGWYNGQMIPSATWALKNLNPTSDKYFNFDDIKPGDYGCETISMHVKKGEAWLCLDFRNLQSNENGQNEPESIVDITPNFGELADNLQFFGWIDPNGNGIYNPGEKILFGTSTKAASTVLASTTYPIGDSGNGGSCKPGQTKYVSMCWCAGILTMDTQTGKMTCDGTQLGNIAQTDTMTLDVQIRALEKSTDSKFLCNPGGRPQYCSHGYWKQSHHFDNWVNYSPNQLFSSVFDNAFPGKTLLQVLNQGGGGLNRLGRETVGALLNAGKLGNFPYTQAQVISMFNAAYPGSSNSYSNLADKFQIPENCPLN
jgi:hypothetical protein